MATTPVCQREGSWTSGRRMDMAMAMAMAMNVDVNEDE